jgi:acetyl esterase/lipase
MTKITNLLSLIIIWAVISSSAFSAEETPSTTDQAADASHGRIIRDLSYRPTMATDPAFARCVVDLYLPNTQNFPTLVWFHGGGLIKGSHQDASTKKIAVAFMLKGIAVASVSYRLSPTTTFPGYVEDAATAFAFVHQLIPTYGGQPNQVFIGGHSAGAYLTLMVTMDPSYLQRAGLHEKAIAGAISFSAQTLTHQAIRAERGLPDIGVLVDNASPLNFIRAITPPLLIITAEHDMPARVEENTLFVAMEQALKNKEINYYFAKDRTHATTAGSMANEGDPVAQQVMDFIRRIAATRP